MDVWISESGSASGSASGSGLAIQTGGAALSSTSDTQGQKNWSQITKLIKGLIQSKEQKSIPEMMKFSEKAQK